MQKGKTASEKRNGRVVLRGRRGAEKKSFWRKKAVELPRG